MKKQMRFHALLLAVVLLLTAVSPAAAAVGEGYVDLPPEGHWSREGILFVMGCKLMKGVDETHFAPKKVLTRGQMAVILWQRKGRGKEPSWEKGVMPFRDVKEGSYYYKAVQYLWESGIIAGVSADRFAPNEPCTRAQVAFLLWKTAIPVPTGGVVDFEPVRDINDFVDVEPGSYYYDALRNFVELGILAGTDATHLSPNKSCTRAEFATIYLSYFMNGYV